MARCEPGMATKTRSDIHTVYIRGGACTAGLQAPRPARAGAGRDAAGAEAEISSHVESATRDGRLQRRVLQRA